MNQRWIRWGLVLNVCLAGIVASHTQQTTDLQLAKRVDAPQVAAGDRLIYTLTLTNTGPAQVTGLVVNDVTPPGTAFVGASTSCDWLVTTPEQGGAGNIVWRSVAPLDPGQSVELAFQVIVQTQGNGKLTSPGFTAQADGWDSPLTSPDVTVTLLAPTASSPKPPPWLLGSAAIVLIAGLAALAFEIQRRRQPIDLY